MQLVNTQKIFKVYRQKRRAAWCVKQDFNKEHIIPNCANEETDEVTVSWAVGRDTGNDMRWGDSQTLAIGRSCSRPGPPKKEGGSGVIWAQWELLSWKETGRTALPSPPVLPPLKQVADMKMAWVVTATEVTSTHRAGQKEVATEWVWTMTRVLESDQLEVCAYFMAFVQIYWFHKYLLSSYKVFSAVLGV